MGQGGRNIRVAHGKTIVESLFEVRAHGGHVVKGTVAAEATVHALPFLQGRVGNLRGREELTGGELKCLEGHDDRRARQPRGTLQRYGTQWQRAGDGAEGRIHEERTDVILGAQDIDNFTRHDTVVAGDVHEVGATAR